MKWTVGADLYRTTSHHDAARTPELYASAISCSTNRESNFPEKVDAMLQQAVIESVQSKESSPVVLGLKLEGSWRLHIGYSRLNAIKVCNSYPISRMVSFVDPLGKETWFSALDEKLGTGKFQ